MHLQWCQLECLQVVFSDNHHSEVCHGYSVEHETEIPSLVDDGVKIQDDSDVLGGTAGKLGRQVPMLLCATAANAREDGP